MRTSEITRIRTVGRAKGQVRAGLRYAWDSHEVREVLVSVVLVGLLAFNFTVTLPLLARTVLHGSGADLSFVTCSMGLGGLIGGLYVAHRSRPTRRLLVLLALTFGVLMAAVAVAPSVLVACLAIIPMGAASLAFVSTANATLQLNSREEMRGRVMSLYAMGFLGTTPIGAIIIGVVAATSSARVAIGVGAAANLLAGTYLYLTSRERAPARLPATSATVT
jgi:predicted MFS family arabinose efflux permease